MSISITGFDEVREGIEQGANRAVAHVYREMKIEAKKIQELAVKMAPIDDGNLEKVILVHEIGGRNALGRFAKKTIEIGIDEAGMATPVPGRPGKTIGDYAYEMHEHLTPYGPLNLGPHSQEKQGRNNGVVVGGGYIARAGEELGPGIAERIAAKL